jgi:hypothetical protein
MLFSETEAIGFLREIIECAIGVSTIFDAYPGLVLSDVNGFELAPCFLWQSRGKAGQFNCDFLWLHVLRES